MDAGLNVVSASFADPYVLLLKEDSTIMVLKADEKGDLEEIESGKTFSRSKWLSGSLYEDSNDFLRLESGNEDDDESGNVLMFLLGTGGGLQVSIFSTAGAVVNMILVRIINDLRSHRSSIFPIFKSPFTLPLA